ncbi:chemoreceptor glutamine deamidase CheD [Oleiagrimonas sp. C23AA]|nr:chemoreceptor glutamine deamidase CheD [Oleiagrimonas sp. C23AA]
MSVLRASHGASPPLHTAPTYSDAKVLRGFEHVRRYWEPSLGCMAVKLLPGEYYATVQEEMVSTVLGSCVAACVRDRNNGIGGMNHFLLPEPLGERGSWGSDATSRAARYGVDAMEQLINAVLKAGADRSSLEVKIFGGGQVLAQVTDVGKRNVEFVRRYLQTEGLKVIGEDVLDIYPRHVRYFPWTGKAQVKRLRPQQDQSLADRERSYLKRLVNEPITGEVELF